ncbi:cytidine deaminase [bacterium]|nr:cytidine deaminase [bacterium]
MGNDTYKNLLEMAKEASKKSYSPYSNFPVGACVLYESGRTYQGCNVENVSYGLSLCAERNAISSAIAQGEKTKIKAIAIFCPKQNMCLPCGACRQWISEFCISQDDTKIVMENHNKEVEVLKLGDIFPFGFKIENE